MAWDTAATLLAAFRSESGRPSTSEDISTDATLYAYLSLAQNEVFREIASVAPHSQWLTTQEKMTTADGGYTYSTAYYPFGSMEVRASRTGRLLVPGAEWDAGADYVALGQTIRMTNNRQVTFADGPYALYGALPADIDGTHEPTLKPAHARQLIVWRALSKWAKKGYADPAPFDAEYQRAAWGDPRNPGDVGVIGALRVQHARAGGGSSGGMVSNMAGWASGGGAGW